MHDLSPGTPVSQDSQKIPLYESSNTALNDEQDDLYNIHWDMLNEDILLSLERENLFAELYDPPKLELDLDTSWIEAPLASPEELSVASGLFGLSRDNSYKKKCVSSTSVKLETIQQSPDMKVKLDTPKGSSDGIFEDKTGAVPTEITVTEPVDNVEDQSVRKVDSSTKSNIDSTSPNLNETHKPTSDHIQSDSHSIIEDKNIHSHHLSPPEIQPSSLSSTDNSVMECDSHVYDRHSPVESTQFQHLNPNDHYSPAGLGYTPECSGVRHPSPRQVHSPKVHSPNNKRLHYSQSESYIGTLSDKYSMKRSKEQGDIAHLQDSTRVYEVNSSKSHEKLLKPRESEPIFEESKLPTVQSAILETSDHLEDEQSPLVEKIEDELGDSYLEISADIRRESEKLFHMPPSEVTDESDKKLVKTDELPAVEIDETLVTSVDSLIVEDKDLDMRSTNSRLSVSDGAYSGSEKRSSSSSGQLTSGHSISDHSDEYTMVETDV